MKWLTVVVCAALLACETRCSCTSTMTIALSVPDFTAFDEDANVTLCLDSTCYDFVVAKGAGGAVTKDGAVVMDVSRDLRRLVIISNEIHGDQSRDVTLAISSGGAQRVSRSWPGAEFTAKEGESNVDCESPCVQAGLF